MLTTKEKIFRPLSSIENFVRGSAEELLRVFLGWGLRLNRSLSGIGTAPEPVFDILNAGPRHRFCTPNFVAHNCLQLGYGSGAVKFIAAAVKEGFYEILEDEAKLFMEKEQPTTPVLELDGTTSHRAATLEECVHMVAHRLVQSYRKSNPLITGFWGHFDNVLMEAFREKGDHNIEITMPSGEPLKYFYLRAVFKEEIDPKTGKTEKKRSSWTVLTARGDPSSIRHRVWGGFVTENVTQRMARDVIGHGLLNLEDAGLPVRWHSHDEVILEADEDIAKAELERAKEIMRIPPPWAPDLPLAVEGGIFDHYVK